MNALREHPLRAELQAEIHARPTLPMRAPVTLTYLVCVSPSDNRERELERVDALTGSQRLASDQNYHALRLDQGWLIWERHTEFARYTLVSEAAGETALDLVPEGWVEALPGSVLLAAHCFVRSIAGDDERAEAERMFGPPSFAGSRIADGAATVFTDFDTAPRDQYNRLLMIDHGMTEYQMGRNVQRILEINTYWLLALLALPAA